MTRGPGLALRTAHEQPAAPAPPAERAGDFICDFSNHFSNALAVGAMTERTPFYLINPKRPSPRREDCEEGRQIRKSGSPSHFPRRPPFDLLLVDLQIR